VNPSAINEGESGGSSSFNERSEELMIQPKNRNELEKINNQIDINDGPQPKKSCNINDIINFEDSLEP
jgi:hypothetical protein